jgi:hypothetical protein
MSRKVTSRAFREAVKRGASLPAATVDRLMKEVCLAVSEFGPHGDLHAGNVLIGISADGNSFVAKVCDWSPVVSRSLSGDASAQAVALAARGVVASLTFTFRLGRRDA